MEDDYACESIPHTCTLQGRCQNCNLYMQELRKVLNPQYGIFIPTKCQISQLYRYWKSSSSTNLCQPHSYS